MTKKWITILSNLPAGGGWVIDLLYCKNTKEVCEIKSSPDGRRSDTYFPVREFIPELYGPRGEYFLEKIKEVK